MKNVVRHIVTGTLMLLVLWGTSCSHDTEAFGISDKETALSIGFRLPTRSLKSGEGYEVGETYENYIDVENNNYRIYFFTSDNKFIACFEPDGFVAAEGSDYRDYSVLGKAPAALVNHQNFKMVVLANWPQYGDDTMKTGETLLADICDAGWGQFDCFSSFELGPERLIPFYGVHEYNNIEFKSGEVTLLSESVTLLRAVAKVEVMLKTDDHFDLSFSEVKIRRYNKKGYCAPTTITAVSGIAITSAECTSSKIATMRKIKYKISVSQASGQVLMEINTRNGLLICSNTRTSTRATNIRALRLGSMSRPVRTNRIKSISQVTTRTERQIMPTMPSVSTSPATTSIVSPSPFATTGSR